MPRIRCHYVDCVFVDEGYCGAAAIEVDPDLGCMTYSRADDGDLDTDEWDDDEMEMDEWDDLEGEDEDDELWIDEDDF